MHKAGRLATLLMVTLAIVSGCASPAPPLTPDTPGQLTSYTLSAGDRVRISVYNEPALSNEFAVSDDGSISFPLIGNVPVGGKTVEQSQALLRSRLGDGYVNDPRVTVEVINYRPYYVLGEVGKPGQFPFSVGLTIPQAVAIAGGFSYRANTRVIFIRRNGDSVERQIDVTKNTVYLQPGDTIRVGERYF